MRQVIHEVVVPTRGRGLHEITARIEELTRESGLRTGLATLYLQHTSASLLIQENADPDVRGDLDRFFARLAPDGDPLFRHDCEGPDDMPAHLRTALTSVNLSIPIREGRLTLGTWQGIYVWEHRTRSHHRRLIAHLMGE